LKYVVPHVYEYLHITQAQFDKLNAILGWTTLACQIPSGILADKLSGKKLLIVSVIMTGTLTILFGLVAQSVFQESSLIIMYIIFIGFGISTTLFLWSPLW
jgi:MFS family permease